MTGSPYETECRNCGLVTPAGEPTRCVCDDYRCVVIAARVALGVGVAVVAVALMEVFGL